MITCLSWVQLGTNHRVRYSCGLSPQLQSTTYLCVCVCILYYMEIARTISILGIIIHPCDPTVVICYLIWPCDIAVCITYLISHSYSLTYNLRIFQFGCKPIINTKLHSSDDIISRRLHHSVFPAGALKALVLRTRASKHQLWKLHDVRRIISTHSGGFVYLSHQVQGHSMTLIFFSIYHNQAPREVGGAGAQHRGP